jgi:hypothetical protein
METGIKNLRSADVRQFPWLEAMVAALDDRLRVRHGVIEYTNSPECLFRIQLAASNDDYVLSDGTCIRAGDRIANLHVWNEQFPCFTGKGPTLAGRSIPTGVAVLLLVLLLAWQFAGETFCRQPRSRSWRWRSRRSARSHPEASRHCDGLRSRIVEIISTQSRFPRAPDAALHRQQPKEKDADCAAPLLLMPDVDGVSSPSHPFRHPKSAAADFEH